MEYFPNSGEVKIIELIAFILDHIVVFPFIFRRSLTAPGTGTVTGLCLRRGGVAGRGGAVAGRVGWGFRLGGIVLAVGQALIGTLRIDHIAGVISINFDHEFITFDIWIYMYIYLSQFLGDSIRICAKATDRVRGQSSRHCLQQGEHLQFLIVSRVARAWSLAGRQTFAQSVEWNDQWSH